MKHAISWRIMRISYAAFQTWPNPPAPITSIIKKRIYGDPTDSQICTSHVERLNLSVGMSTRRFTRLTNAFSKKWENHEAALGLFFAFYNYCRPHMTLTEEMGYRCTPAMRSGLANHVWTVEELLRNAAE